jgi:hypothetical protein
MLAYILLRRTSRIESSELSIDNYREQIKKLCLE